MSPADLGQVSSPSSFSISSIPRERRFQASGCTRIQALRRSPTCWKAVSDTKTRPRPPGSCLRVGSNGSRPVTVHGTAAVLESPAGHADSSSGSPCRPNMNSDRPKASTLAERAQTVRIQVRRRAAEEAARRQRRLLRAGGEWPKNRRRCRAADERDKFASPHHEQILSRSTSENLIVQSANQHISSPTRVLKNSRSS
jgi:hypothetical protein